MSIAVALVVLGLSALGATLAWHAGGPAGADLEPATPVRVVVLAYLVLCVAGSVVLALIDATSGPGPLLVGGAMLALGLGVWFGARQWGRPAPIPVVVPLAGEAPVAPARTRWPMVLVLAAAGFVALLWIAVEAGLPLLSSDPQGSRASFAGWRLDAFRWLAPPAAVATFTWALARPTPSRLAVGVAALACVAGIEVLFGSRALPFELGAAAFLVAWWSGRRPRIRTLVGLAAAGAVLFVGVQLARLGPEASFRDSADVVRFVAQRTVNRVVMIQPRTIEVAVDAVPGEEPFWGGATYARRLFDLVGLPDDHPTLGIWLFERLFPGVPPGFAAPGILAEGWVNAGPVLALGLLFLLGLGGQWLGRRVGQLGPGPIDRAAAALATVALARSYATSLNGLLLTLAAITAWWVLTRPGAAATVARIVPGLWRPARGR